MAAVQHPEPRRSRRHRRGAQGRQSEVHPAKEAQSVVQEVEADVFDCGVPDTFSQRSPDPSVDSDSEDEAGAESACEESDYPTEVVVYADTDSEGEPQVKTAAELWPGTTTDRRMRRLPASRRSRQASKESVASRSTCAPLSRSSSKESTCSWTPASTSAESDSLGGSWALVSSSAESVSLSGSWALASTPAGSVPLGGPWTQDSTRAALKSLGGHELDDSAVTTLVVRNVPESATQREFLAEVDASGFAGAYDFAYLPHSFDGGLSGLHAFLNFKTPRLAASFKAAWHFSTRLGMNSRSVALNVVAASIQGFRANADRWTASRVARAQGPEFLPFICPEPTRELEAGRHLEVNRPGHARQATTLAVRNLPEHITQQEFLDAVNRSGFAGKYDFAYVPRSRDSGRGGGHAFLNFRTAETASIFKAAWHRTARLGAISRCKALSVVASSVQGFDANAAKWTPSRVAQVKNPSFLPFIFRSSAGGHEAD